MSNKKGRILIVEDDRDIANLLKLYFSNQGYTVSTAHRGKDALEQARRHAPGLVILDIDLPDISGYEVCRSLRSTALTRYVPIIFLTGRRDRHHMIEGLELGVDDYITKPFDIEVLKLRIENSLALSEGMRGINELSGFPTTHVLEQHLKKLFKAKADWTYLDIRIHHFEEFSEIYSWSAANEVIRTLAMLIRDVIDSEDPEHTFMGHPSRDTFVLIITDAQAVDALIQRLEVRFLEDVQAHYSYIDRDNGYMVLNSGGQRTHIDLMRLEIVTISSTADSPDNIEHLNEILTAKRHQRNNFNAKNNIMSQN